METATHGVRTSDQCDGARIHEESLEIPRGKTTSDVSGAIQMLEELVRKYEKHRDRKYDTDLKVQRLYERFPKPIEQQVALKDRDG